MAEETRAVAIKIKLPGGGSARGGEEFNDEASARNYFAGKRKECFRQGGRIIYALLIRPNGTIANLNT